LNSTASQSLPRSRRIIIWSRYCSAISTSRARADGDTLSPVQEAFIEAGAFQCGYCTPGFLLMATQLLDENPDPDDDAIRHYLSGNLCRCAAYPEIINAVKIAARKRKGATAPA